MQTEQTLQSNHNWDDIYSTENLNKLYFSCVIYGTRKTFIFPDCSSVAKKFSQ